MPPTKADIEVMSRDATIESRKLIDGGSIETVITMDSTSSISPILYLKCTAYESSTAPTFRWTEGIFLFL